VGSVIPGSTTATNSTDTAYFSALLTAARTVTVDTNRNIRNITFDAGNSGTFGYTLSGGRLLLTSGGTISSTGGVGAHTDTISSPMTIIGNNATYRFNNDSSLATRSLTISGSVTGQSIAGGTTTLYLGGNNSGTNRFTGLLNAGTSGGSLALVKDGSTTWEFGGVQQNRYDVSPITINAGTLLFSYSGNATPAQPFGGARSMTLANVAGAQLDFGTRSHANQFIGFGSLSGGGPLGGNIVNAGYVSNGIFIGLDNTDTSFGGRFISGTNAINGSGLIKVGTGILTLTGSGNDVGGTTRLRQGGLRLDFSQAWTGTDILASNRAISFQGGRLLLTGSNSASNSQTFASGTVESGMSGIALSSNGATGLVASLGAITRNAGGTLDITLPADPQSATNGVRTTTTNVNNGVLSSVNGSSGIAYATVSGTTWAALSSGNIVPLTSYATGTANYTATNNVNVTMATPSRRARSTRCGSTAATRSISPEPRPSVPVACW
jgi:autotransporter-associated beta strand protein